MAEEDRRTKALRDIVEGFSHRIWGEGVESVDQQNGILGNIRGLSGLQDIMTKNRPLWLKKTDYWLLDSVGPVEATRKLVNNTGNSEQLTFPWFSWLPDLVHLKIMSFLSVKDMITLANEIPSEEKYFPAPLNLLQLQEIFPILLKKQMLDAESIMKLSGVNAYFGTFIRNHFQRLLKDHVASLLEIMQNYTISVYNLMMWTTCTVAAPVPLPVRVYVNMHLDLELLSQLKIHHNQIWHCKLIILFKVQKLSLEERLSKVALILQLLPNLRTLSLENRASGFGEPEEAEPLHKLYLLPDLPHLNTLLIEDWDVGAPTLKNCLLYKYGPKCQRVVLPTRMKPPGIPQVLLYGDGATLEQVFMRCVTNGVVFRGLDRFSSCPLKKLDMLMSFSGITPEACLPRLLNLLVRYWGNTLEVLKLNIKRKTRYDAVNNVRDDANDWLAFWGLNKPFKMLRMFQWIDYPMPRDCHFLMAFPALEELGYGETKVEAKWKETGRELALCSDRDRMLNSMVWNLCSKLGKIWFKTFDRTEENGGYEVITRKQWIKSQMQNGPEVSPEPAGVQVVPPYSMSF